MKIFLDANILFSASQIGSPIRKLLENLHLHSVLVSHPGVIEEATRNLAAKKPEWIEGFKSLRNFLEISPRLGTCPETSLPAKDQPVLAAAIGCRADILLTGDRRHFGPLFGSTLSGVKVFSVRQMAEEMVERGWLDQ
jgi:predicted nucleic acid-binding protein